MLLIQLIQNRIYGYSIIRYPFLKNRSISYVCFRYNGDFFGSGPKFDPILKTYNETQTVKQSNFAKREQNMPEGILKIFPFIFRSAS